jgi:hypothetical protein
MALVLAFGFGLFVVSVPSFAQSDENITQKKIARIRDHCVENQASLNRLHQNDAFLRTNRGNLYRTISDKLMIPLNQRLVANRLDGGDLITVAADFDSEYDRFYSSYIAYDNALTELLAVDCSKQPVTFYNALLNARTKRAELSSSNQKLKQLVEQYGNAFKIFKAEQLKEKAS